MTEDEKKISQVISEMTDDLKNGRFCPNLLTAIAYLSVGITLLRRLKIDEVKMILSLVESIERTR